MLHNEPGLDVLFLISEGYNVWM